jgi:hypothetical protein
MHKCASGGEHVIMGFISVINYKSLLLGKFMEHMFYTGLIAGYCFSAAICIWSWGFEVIMTLKGVMADINLSAPAA